MSNSSLLAVKTLNQYRKRDVLSYIGLRYYLKNSAAKQCRWINDVATRLSSTQNEPSYLRTFHFKELSESGSITHREIYLPAPNEALSETALLVELSQHSAFQPRPYVYSYRFAEHSDKSGVFKPYFSGFKERQADISKACWAIEDGVVLVTDIKRFYPSIRSDLALSVWSSYCKEAALESKFFLLGKQLLNRHQKIGCRDQSANGLLTGPALSHVIANLLLDSIDKKMNQLTGGNYFRYVDDIALVGSSKQCRLWRDSLVEYLAEFDLDLHNGEKDFEVSCHEWLWDDQDINVSCLEWNHYEKLFDSNIGKGWVSLIADVKRYLISKPHRKNLLSEEFARKQVRLPVLDYSNVANESSNLKKVQDWIYKYKWSIKAVNKIDLDYLMNKAEECKISLLRELEYLLKKSKGISKFQYLKLIPKLRYISGRLLVLSDDELLKNLISKLEDYPELKLITSTMSALISKDLTETIGMGVNATQAAVQLLKTTTNEIYFDSEKLKLFNEDLVGQSLAVLSLNNIKFPTINIYSELQELAAGPVEIKLMNSQVGFVNELACLHGLGESLNKDLMNSVFDRDEDLALDIINLIQQSSHV
jgi:hypothetical protein